MGAGSGRWLETDSIVCAGAPLDSHGRLRQTINDCPFDPTAVVVGLTPAPTAPDGWAVVFVASCDLHAHAIAQVIDEAEILAIDALPLLQEEYGEDLWQMVSVA